MCVCVCDYNYTHGFFILLYRLSEEGHICMRLEAYVHLREKIK